MKSAAPHPLVIGEQECGEVLGDGLDRLEALLELEMAEAQELVTPGGLVDSDLESRSNEGNDDLSSCSDT